MGCGTRTPKPSAHIMPPDVWKAPVHLAGSSPFHSLMYGKNPSATMVGQKNNPSVDTARKMSQKSILKVWYNFYVSVT
jgi:hypothetical protein